jgi:hypothetical protein
MADSADENLRPESKPDAIAKLVERIDAHDAEQVAIDGEILRLGLSTKSIKAIRAAKKTLDALMGVDPALAQRVQA